MPFIIYAIEYGTFDEKDLSELSHVQQLLPHSAVFFVRAKDTEDVTETSLSEQLESIGNLSSKTAKSSSWLTRANRCQLLHSTINFHNHLVPILRRQARAYLIQASTQLLSLIEKCMSSLLNRYDNMDYARIIASRLL